MPKLLTIGQGAKIYSQKNRGGVRQFDPPPPSRLLGLRTFEGKVVKIFFKKHSASAQKLDVLNRKKECSDVNCNNGVVVICEYNVPVVNANTFVVNCNNLRVFSLS